MWDVWEKMEMYIYGSEWKNLTEGSYSEDLGIDGRIILKLILIKEYGRV